MREKEGGGGRGICEVTCCDDAAEEVRGLSGQADFRVDREREGWEVGGNRFSSERDNIPPHARCRANHFVL